MFLCLLSSQIPFSSPLEYFLKFVDAHHEFCKQEWLHVRMLEGLNFLTAWPTSFLFSRVMTNANRRLFSVPIKAITQKKNPCNNDKEMNEQVMVKSSSSCTVLTVTVSVHKLHMFIKGGKQPLAVRDRQTVTRMTKNTAITP